jgi:uncharacterized protein YbcI
VSTGATSAIRPPVPTGSLPELSRGLVQLLRHRAGRGPTEARALWAGEEALLVLLFGGYTKAEQTLCRHGRPDTAIEYRRAVLTAMEPQMRALVEESIERRVIAVLAAAHHEPDVMAAVFLLEPLGGGGSGETPTVGRRRLAGASPLLSVDDA